MSIASIAALPRLSLELHPAPIARHERERIRPYRNRYDPRIDKSICLLKLQARPINASSPNDQALFRRPGAGASPPASSSRRMRVSSSRGG
jgi:hypothetical protein